ncbi:hypothetical protein BV20DRAFT_1025111 [Pilatotrama ljubarskyi]|nr:hypothetical protein BV20DRAFT_1025111 [Pilatotrama ljubarskyi]
MESARDVQGVQEAAFVVEDYQATPQLQDPQSIPAVNSEQGTVKDDEPDCMCWPHTKRSLRPTAPLEEVLPSIQTEIERAIESLHENIVLLQEDLSEPEGDLSPKPYGERSRRMTEHWQNMSSSLDYAIMRIIEAPGYLIPQLKCKNSYEQHFAHLVRRDETLRNVEVNFKKTLADAQPLFEAREKFIQVESDMRRRRNIQMAIRAAAIFTLPFAPVLSAALTGLDSVFLSAYVGVQEIMVSEDELRSTSESVESLGKELNEKIAVVQKLRQELAMYKEKAEAQRDDPAARRLLDILTKIHTVKDLVGVISGTVTPQPGEEAKQPSLREVVAAMRDLSDASGAHVTAEDLLPSLDDGHWKNLDERIVALRAALPPAESTS